MLWFHLWCEKKSCPAHILSSSDFIDIDKEQRFPKDMSEHSATTEYGVKTASQINISTIEIYFRAQRYKILPIQTKNRL